MNEDCEVVFVGGLAKMLGRTEAAIRQGITRGVNWLLKSFRIGTRHCWLKQDVRVFLTECPDRKNKVPRIGRPRQMPPMLRDIRG
jgi:hypothetical protein